jgi:hypothetical protein
MDERIMTRQAAEEEARLIYKLIEDEQGKKSADYLKVALTSMSDAIKIETLHFARNCRLNVGDPAIVAALVMGHLAKISDIAVNAVLDAQKEASRLIEETQNKSEERAQKTKDIFDKLSSNVSSLTDEIRETKEALRVSGGTISEATTHAADEIRKAAEETEGAARAAYTKGAAAAKTEITNIFAEASRSTREELVGLKRKTEEVVERMADFAANGGRTTGDRIFKALISLGLVGFVAYGCYQWGFDTARLNGEMAMTAGIENQRRLAEGAYEKGYRSGIFEGTQKDKARTWENRFRTAEAYAKGHGATYDQKKNAFVLSDGKIFCPVGYIGNYERDVGDWAKNCVAIGLEDPSK